MRQEIKKIGQDGGKKRNKRERKKNAVAEKGIETRRGVATPGVDFRQ